MMPANAHTSKKFTRIRVKSLLVCALKNQKLHQQKKKIKMVMSKLINPRIKVINPRINKFFILG